MIFILLAYFLFLIVFFAYNAYMIFRLWQARMKGDATPKAFRMYAIVIGIIILITLLFILTSDWSQSLSALFGGG
ncbi:MAG: hypothetical protein COX39_00825 [Candidatus Nealsonbacteria bacterium CG23_combo_of_CG06-09_8_20_14_all_40_13]|uniref:Uncharacterized protein n=1 Tax=Candidatus Nealsonbacteria bacterium CG23_combo_of_CG06-09_8_20_14_all_40_13 TaxID=1974724 RepID=A0A2G9YRG4_9BACT|nr:MAG: hypothetical protein COX39_00825 [Candidatus Nealsonbacteria bacterium CG23_combo_of_CG06-09_8_20_14_all_40_13]PIU43162.1 MAG: hypothetical protein COS97_02480 [Candidatus Nealsonbacteria bacterium CG07_land_8_20_14_0_80_40_10]